MNTPKTGDQLRDEGTAIVAANNADYMANFDRAASVLMSTHHSFTAEMVVDQIGLPTGSRNIIGSAMRTFAKKHKLRIIGYEKNTRPSAHSRVIARWGKPQP